MKTTMYKSQGRTFKEVQMEFNEDEYTTRDLGFVPDPFFTEHMKTLEGLQKKQRESGLEFDMEKAAAIHGANTPIEAKRLMDMITELPRPDVHLAGEDPALIWFDEISQDGDKMFIEWLKRRKLEQVELQQLPKATVHDEVQFESVREYCQADVVRKHPYMFKIADLVEDPTEFDRLNTRLESDRQFEKSYGFKMAPIFVEAIPDANVIARSVNDTMKKLVKLSVEYKVEIYFGTKAALKPLLYQFMYGARRADMDLSKVDEISVEKAKEIVDNQRKVAIVGGTGIGASLAAAIKGFRAGQMEVIGSGKGMWDFEDFAAIAKVDYPSRDWEQGKLRRGKRHNKFKRKGKK